MARWGSVHGPYSTNVPGTFALAGQVHPRVVPGASGGYRLSLPCFHVGWQGGVLPAFAPFTGMHALLRVAVNRRYELAEGGAARVMVCGRR